jgi:hypothetical protein
MKSIFVSYRREDTSGHAGRLCDRLRAQFRDTRVFMDVDTIQPGVDFVQVIEDAVGSCDVLLALIGDEWLTVSDRFGNRRLDNPEDFIRLEIAAALRRGVPVIPVLLEDARMPSADELPGELARFARIHALDISDKRWEYDIGRLVTVLQGIGTEPEAERQVLPSSPPETSEPAPTTPAVRSPAQARKLPTAKIAAVALLLAVAFGAFFLLGPGDERARRTTIQAGAVAPPAFDASGRQVTYEPENALDNDPSTAWRVEGDGRGVALTLDLGKRLPVRRLGLLPGYAKTDALDHTDRFPQNRRIARVRYRFDGGASVEQQFADRPVIQTMDVRVETRRITIEILETVPGDPNFDYTAISEIMIDTADG